MLLAVVQLSALGLDQSAQVIEQLRVASADDIDKIRERQRSSGAGLEQLTERLARNLAVQLFPAEPWRVAGMRAPRSAASASSS